MAIDLSRDDLKQAMMDALKESGRDLNFNGKDVDRLMKSLLSLDKEVGANRSTMGGLVKEMLTGRKVFKDFTHDLEQIDKELEKLAENTEDTNIQLQQELTKRRESIQLMAQHNSAQKAVIQGLTAFSKTTVGVAGRTMSGFAKGLQDGSSAFSLAGGVMEGAMDVANAGAQAIGGGMAAVGGTLTMSTNPRVRALGLVAAVAGAAVSGLGDAANAVGKFIVGYMVKQLELTVDAFNKTSAAGALFADGMTGMTLSASRAGLTVQQFGDVISKNSSMLSASGFGVGQAARLMGQVGENMRKTGITTNLLKLGYGFQEQAELSAQVMADMRTANSTLLNDPAGIAKATEKYATNLRIIASVTGEDAKKKMDEARKASANVAFRSKMMELESKHPGIYEKYLAASASMTEQQRQNVQEAFVFGGVINETGAVMDASNSALRNFTQSTAESLRNGTFSTEENRKLQADTLETFRQSVKNGDLTNIGMAGMAGQLGPLNTALSELMLASDRITKKAVEDAETNAEKQKTANDKLTASVVQATNDIQQMAIDIQELVLPKLSQFAVFSGQIINKLKEMVKDFDSANGPASEDSFGRKALDYGGTALGALIGGSLVGAGTFGLGTAAGAVGGAFTGQAAGIAIADALGLQKKGEIKSKPSGSQVASGIAPTIPNNLLVGPRTGSGNITQSMQEKLDLISKAFPGARITSLNDSDIVDRTGSAHALGNAIDFVPKNFDPKLTDQYVKMLRDMGFKHAAFEKEGQRNANGSVASGNHLHAELKNGGITNGPSLAGEAGAEAVVPLPDGRTIPVKMDTGDLVAKMEELIRIAKDQRDNSEKMLNAVR
jgi:hypothetical protein